MTDFGPYSVKLKQLWLGLLPILVWSCSDQHVVHVGLNQESAIHDYAGSRIEDHFQRHGWSVIRKNGLSSNSGIAIVRPDQVPGKRESVLEADGYQILRKGDQVLVVSPTDRGGLYGLLDIIEQLGNSTDLTRIRERSVNPAFSFRGIKFNLPWSPYRSGPAVDLHFETCRDLVFWESFLDMMVKNRFNALSLWNQHPFPYMIRAANYPDATPFDEPELAQWQSFWKSLFKMAKDRGIETYLVNWNIVVSPEFAEAYGAQVHDDRSDLVKDYTRESVTQVINEYEDLSGLGVTLADWMGNWGDDLMTPTEREDWIEQTFVEGINNADRKVKFIHRAVLAGDPKEMRRVIDHAHLPERTIVEVKFNWSHGHSTPILSLTHANHDGTIMRDFWDPRPENYFIAWMIRNEDFFVLRWGDPEFIRQHIKANHHEYVDGYFVGSEGYIPALDYSHKEPHPHKTWNYAFQKQWMFYHLWGRLTYDPDETDQRLAEELQRRYGNIDGPGLLKAYSLASGVPLQLATFYKSTWDFTLYSEGFLSPRPIGFDDKKSPFISIEELIRHETLDSRYLSVSDYCLQEQRGERLQGKRITPLRLAATIQENCSTALTLLDTLRLPNNHPALNSELDDLETWCHLGLYFADKLRAGVALENFNLSKRQPDREESLRYLQKCRAHWANVIRLTADRYKPMPLVSIGPPNQEWSDYSMFHWSDFLEDVEYDIQYVENLAD